MKIDIEIYIALILIQLIRKSNSWKIATPFKDCTKFENIDTNKNQICIGYMERYANYIYNYKLCNLCQTNGTDISLSFSERSLIRRRLETVASKEIQVAKLEEVKIKCESDVLENYLDSQVKWMHNDKNISNRHFTIDNGRTLVIQAAEYNDTGLYMCFMQTGKNEHFMIDITALIISDETILIKSEMPVQIPCFASIIKSLFMDRPISQVWYKDNEVISNRTLDSTILDSYSIDFYRIPSVLHTDEALYTCVVVDSLLKRSWTLNRVELVVDESQPMFFWFTDERYRLALKSFAAFLALLTLLNFIWNLITGIY